MDQLHCRHNTQFFGTQAEIVWLYPYLDQLAENQPAWQCLLQSLFAMVRPELQAVLCLLGLMTRMGQNTQVFDQDKPHTVLLFHKLFYRVAPQNKDERIQVGFVV